MFFLQNTYVVKDTDPRPLPNQANIEPRDFCDDPDTEACDDTLVSRGQFSASTEIDVCDVKVPEDVKISCKDDSSPANTGGAFCKDGLCELFGPSPDCNGNGVHDTCESPNPCPGNIVGGCSVGIVDFLQVLAAWGPCVGFCPADIDEDNQVGIIDLLELLAHWGPCP